MDLEQLRIEGPVLTVELNSQDRSQEPSELLRVVAGCTPSVKGRRQLPRRGLCGKAEDTGHLLLSLPPLPGRKQHLPLVIWVSGLGLLMSELEAACRARYL